jgi:phage tail sheath gpL-like
MSTIILTIKSEDPQTHDKQKYQLDASKPKEQAQALSQMFKDLASGHKRARLDVQTASTDPVAASGTFTLDTVIATDVVVVGPITFTGTDTPTTALHFDTSLATDALIAANLAQVINAHPTTSLVVHASAAGDVVTITAKQKGVIGNFIAISSPDSTITASAAFLASGTGGAQDTAVSYPLGIA